MQGASTSALVLQLFLLDGVSRWSVSSPLTRLIMLCAQVREAVSILDLDVQYKPCPAGGPTWREEVKRMGGKASFPYMNDPNTGESALSCTGEGACTAGQRENSKLAWLNLCCWCSVLGTAF